MKCASCDGVAHEATGCQWSRAVLVCHGCAVSFWQWMIGHTNDKPRKKKSKKNGKPSPDFYGAALRKEP